MAADDIAVSIEDEGAAHHYRTEIPNLVDELGLTVYAFRLYVHLKRTAGDGGICRRGYRSMAERCKMSLGSIAKARRELVANGLIRCVEKQTGPVGRRGFHITIIDLWTANMRHFAPGGPGRRTTVPITEHAADLFAATLAHGNNWSERMRAAEPVREMCRIVATAIGIEPTKSQYSYWARGAIELLDVGATGPLVEAAAVEMRRRGLAMVSPRSLVTTVQRLKADQRRAPGASSTPVYIPEDYPS